ncbi:MAG TPA: hypothetical protein VMC03_13885 [Streptosporangiaceae bacterium]|nr:hypothetical protein [Streptosporangiaceae bacterium]
MLEHPVVQDELRKLEEQVTTQLVDQAGRTPGRHRSASAAAAGRRGSLQIGDASGFDLKPDPLAATTEAQFIKALWDYKAWSGDPSWRAMAARAGQRVVHSTMYGAMHGSVLPKLEVVKAIISGCGGGEEDLRAFATAWRQLDISRSASALSGRSFLAAPVPPRELVRS